MWFGLSILIRQWTRLPVLILAIFLGGCDRSPTSDDVLENRRRDISEEFTKKKTCADYGRAALAEIEKDITQAGSEVFTSATAEWCYNQEANTCLFIASSTTFAVSLQGDLTRVGDTVWQIKDQFTNTDIAHLAGKDLNDAALVAGFEALKVQLCPRSPENSRSYR